MKEQPLSGTGESPDRGQGGHQVGGHGGLGVALISSCDPPLVEASDASKTGTGLGLFSVAGEGLQRCCADSLGQRLPQCCSLCLECEGGSTGKRRDLILRLKVDNGGLGRTEKLGFDLMSGQRGGTRGAVRFPAETHHLGWVGEGGLQATDYGQEHGKGRLWFRPQRRERGGAGRPESLRGQLSSPHVGETHG